MPVPSHKWDCETMIWPTRCPDCRDAVYFFSCTCGSKEFAKTRGLQIPPEIATRLDDLLKGRKQRVTISGISPADTKVSIVGQVVEINEVSFFKRLGYRSNSIGRALLGKLAAEPYVEIVLRERPTLRGAQNEYRFFSKKASSHRADWRQGA